MNLMSLRIARSNMCSVGLQAPSDLQEDKVDNKPSNLTLLSGEEYIFQDVPMSEGLGSINMTNYRLVILYKDSNVFVPLGVVEQTEVKKISTLIIFCKDAKSYKCTFTTIEECLEWQRKIDSAISCPSDLKNVFATVYYNNLSIDNPDLHSILASYSNGLSYAGLSNKSFEDEVKRMKFDMIGVWKISNVNDEYGLCSSYPRKLIVPSSIQDENLESVAKFRAARRLPVVVWRHPNGAIIARSSQPEVGWLGWRSAEDEDYIKALSEACHYDSPTSTYSRYDYKSPPCKVSNIMTDSNDVGLSLNNSEEGYEYGVNSEKPSLLPDAVVAQREIKKLLIVDARSYATSVANRARGGGYESPDYYPLSEIKFMNLENIHTIRKSHQALRQLVSLPSDIPNWFSLLENTRWFVHMSGLLKAALTVAETVANEARPVLVHCSDGWDRTPQITSLAEILMDPYYRTLEGFQVLVDREWIEFGHKFSDRCGSGVGADDVNERSPIFLQFLDCVYQLQIQFPTAFQFNQSFLVKLSQHVYSNMFGTFLFNSSQMRMLSDQEEKMYSVWSYFKLNQQQYLNLLYNSTFSVPVLPLSVHCRDMQLWQAVYITKDEKNLEDSPTVTDELSCNEEDIPKHEKDLVKTKSCDDLAVLAASTGPQIGRRLSDSHLRDGVPDLVLLKSALGSEVLDGSNSDLCNSKNVSQETEDVGIKKNLMDVELSPSHVNTNGYIDMNDFFPKNMMPLTTIDQINSNVNHSDFLSQPSNLELCRKMIEGSTDTLVNECGVLGCEEVSINEKTPKFETMIATTSVIENEIPFGEKEHTLSATKLSHLTLCDVTSFPEERFQDEFSLQKSSIAECTTCYKSRKLLNEVKNVDIWRGSYLPDNAVNGFSTSQKSVRVNRYSTPGHSRSPSSGIASTPNNERAFLGNSEKPVMDGLSAYSDEITRRLEQINFQHQVEVDNLNRELHRVKLVNQQLLQNKLNHHNQENHLEDQVSLPDSIGSGSGGSVGQESGVSDASWEAVEEGDFNLPTLWLPDHAVECCMGCHSAFWMGRRKHHCRSCGKIFCADCSGNCVPIPKENLYDPVRVCRSCYNTNINDDRFKTPITVASN